MELKLEPHGCRASIWRMFRLARFPAVIFVFLFVFPPALTTVVVLHAQSPSAAGAGVKSSEAVLVLHAAHLLDVEHGTLGSPAAGNVPGGRGYASSWTEHGLP